MKLTYVRLLPLNPLEPRAMSWNSITCSISNANEAETSLTSWTSSSESNKEPTTDFGMVLEEIARE